MASAKKGKKNKGKTVPLVDFLQDTPGTVPTMPIRKSTLNWADEVEDIHDLYDSRSNKTSNVILPTAPKASRDFDDIIDKVPQNGPFMAYLSNLPYDIDESEISYFFRNMKIANMKIPKDDRPGDMPKLKGFGYVEFEDRDSLLQALVIPDTTIKNRRIRIELASENDNDRRRGGRMDMNRDRNPRSDSNTSGDWRSGPRQESSEGEQRRPFSRDRDRERDGDSSSSSAWRDGDRRLPRDSDRPFTRSNNDRFRGDQDRDRDQDYGGRRGGDRDDKFMSRNRYDGGGGGGGSGGRAGGGGGFTRGPPPNRDTGDYQSSESSRGEPRQRPKLVLAPRTKPVEEEAAAAAPAVAVATAVSSTSIFGNAKPVDTSARERQIEERIARDNEAVREQKRERDETVITRETERSSSSAAAAAAADLENKPELIEKEEEQEVEEVDVPKKEERKGDVNGVTEKSHPRRNGDHENKRDKGENNEDKHNKPDAKNKREEKREKGEREMPKMKKAEPPNFIANNKFAYLENEDTSD